MPRYGENIYKRKDGRWEGRYIKNRNEDGKIQYGYVYSKDYTETRRKLFTMKIKYQNHYASYEQSRVNYTLAEWYQLWLDKLKENVSPNTFRSYNSKLKNHILPLIGEQTLATINPDTIAKVVEQLKSQMATSSLHASFRVLKICLESAVEAGLLDVNPAKKIRLPKTERAKVRAFSKQEQQRIENSIWDIRDYPILLAMETGLRIGEICGLKWTDIDMEEEILHVERSLQRCRIAFETSASALMEAPLKTATSKRTVPMSRKVLELLTDLRKEAPASEYVCSHKNHQPMDPRVINYRFRKVKAWAGVSDLPFHALRHTFATRCVEASIPITTISALLGHSSVKMTLDFYTNSFLSEKKFAIQKIEKRRSHFS